MKNLDYVIQVARQFTSVSAELITAKPYGAGNINDTFLISVNKPVSDHFILQRINQRVFPHPEQIMSNLSVLSKHLLTKASQQKRRWEIVKAIPTTKRKNYFLDKEGNFWRALTFIKGAHTYASVRNVRHAYEAGFALGTFQRLISDLNPQELYDTLPGFHSMPDYLTHYDEVLGGYRLPTTKTVAYAIDEIRRCRSWALRLDEAYKKGILVERPIHGDPKVDNIMVDDRTGRAVSIIDLDTVKPGLVQFDIGDCLRSSCNPLGEETDRFEKISFDLDLCRAILRGYLSEVAAFYTSADYAYIYDGLRILTFEMALRFFTDYLEGNVYFKVHYPEHNLNRALVQFKLLASVERQEKEIRRLIREMAQKERLS